MFVCGGGAWCPRQFVTPPGYFGAFLVNLAASRAPHIVRMLHCPMSQPSQVSFNHDGVFIGGSSSCKVDKQRTSVAALYVLSKDALYTPPPTATEAPADVHAAIYFTLGHPPSILLTHVTCDM